jgi:hypothetical protein
MAIDLEKRSASRQITNLEVAWRVVCKENCDDPYDRAGWEMGIIGDATVVEN